MHIGREQPLPRIRRQLGAAAALQRLAAQLDFKARDMRGNCRTGEAQFARRYGKAVGFNNFQEGGDRSVEVDAGITQYA